MRGIKENLIGQKFNRLTVIGQVEKPKHLNSSGTYWLCKCDCGKDNIVSTKNLRYGSVKSCGCLNREINLKRITKHGKFNSRIYTVWEGMKNRCECKSSKAYKNYGARGIMICEEWKSFGNFYNWAINNGYDENAPRGQCAIDRIDVNGNYEPSNCRWISKNEQDNNKRTNVNITYNNKTLTLTQWSKELNIPITALRHRYYRGWNVKDMFERPVQKRT